MFRYALIALVVLGSMSAALNSAEARQYARGGNVVHTRMAPVVMHRTLPPYTGIHVYQGGSRGR